MSKRKTWRRSEAYRLGWVHGFYDCSPGDGAFWGRRQLGCIKGAKTRAERLYAEGYRDGSSLR